MSACGRNPFHPSFYMQQVWASAASVAVHSHAHGASHPHAPPSEAIPSRVMQLHAFQRLTGPDTAGCPAPADNLDDIVDSETLVKVLSREFPADSVNHTTKHAGAVPGLINVQGTSDLHDTIIFIGGIMSMMFCGFYTVHAIRKITKNPHVKMIR